MIARQGLGSVHGFLSGEFGLHLVLTRFGKRLVDWTGSANQNGVRTTGPIHFYRLGVLRPVNTEGYRD